MVVAHTVCSLLSYIAFLVAFVSGALFLLLERQLKRKTLGRLFHRLPPLEVLDRTNFVALGTGFVLLTAGLACGFLGIKLLFGQWWIRDPKVYCTVLLWFAYLGLWALRLRATLRGHRVAWLSVLGFTLVLLTCLCASWLAPSPHPYAS